MSEAEQFPSAPSGACDFGSLNDHCSIQIFKYLNLYDSVALGNTCKRFNFIFREHVIQHKVLDFKGLKGRFINWLDEFEYLLTDYGQELRHLEMDNYTYARSLDQVLFNMVNDHCSAGNLRSLSLEGIEIGSSFARESSAILHGLKSLTITHCRVNETSLGELLMRCPELEHLTLKQYDIRYGTRQLDPLLKITSPNVRSIKLAFCNIDIEVDTLKLLFSKTPKLRKFIYREIDMQQKNDIPYEIIGKMLPELKKLTYAVRIDQNIKSIDQLGSSLTLQSLKVTVSPMQERHLVEYMQKAASVGNLRVLSVQSNQSAIHPFNEFSTLLCQMTSLQKLKISQMPKVTSRIVEIAERLPLLEELSIDEISMDFCGLNKKQLLKFLDSAKKMRRVKFHFIASLLGDRVLPIDMELINQLREVVKKREQNSRSLKLQFCCTKYEGFKYIDDFIEIDCERCQCKDYFG